MAIQSVAVFAFALLMVCCILLNAVNGNWHEADEFISNDVGYGDFRETISTANQTPTKRSNYSGCNKSHCWKRCNGVDDGKWCFTTKSYAESYDFVPCTNDSECDASLECGGPCRMKSQHKKTLHRLQRLEHIENQIIQNNNNNKYVKNRNKKILLKN